MPTAHIPARTTMATSIGIEIVRKFADQTGLVVNPRRWVSQQNRRSVSAMGTSFTKASRRRTKPTLPSAMPSKSVRDSFEDKTGLRTCRGGITLVQAFVTLREKTKRFLIRRVCSALIFSGKFALNPSHVRVLGG